MPINSAAADKVLAQIDRQELAELARDLVDLPSPTGQEKAVADYILDWYARHGLRPVRQEIEVDRPNAVGVLKGQGGGLSLQFNGHMDTSFTGTEADRRMVARLEPDAELRGSIEATSCAGSASRT